jgi:hypothetical protein
LSTSALFDHDHDAVSLMTGAPHFQRQAAVAPRPTQFLRKLELKLAENPELVPMVNAFEATGGLALEEEVVAQFRRRRGPNAAQLAWWRARREIIAFQWRTDTWIPLFQFNRFELAPHAQMRPVLEALNSVYEPWGVANWFAQPNTWLHDRTPVQVMVKDLPAVLYAARIDRLIAIG